MSSGHGTRIQSHNNFGAFGQQWEYCNVLKQTEYPLNMSKYLQRTHKNKHLTTIGMYLLHITHNIAHLACIKIVPEEAHFDQLMFSLETLPKSTVPYSVFHIMCSCVSNQSIMPWVMLPTIRKCLATGLILWFTLVRTNVLHTEDCIGLLYSYIFMRIELDNSVQTSYHQSAMF